LSPGIVPADIQHACTAARRLLCLLAWPVVAAGPSMQ